MTQGKIDKKYIVAVLITKDNLPDIRETLYGVAETIAANWQANPEMTITDNGVIAAVRYTAVMKHGPNAVVDVTDFDVKETSQPKPSNKRKASPAYQGFPESNWDDEFLDDVADSLFEDFLGPRQ